MGMKKRNFCERILKREVTSKLDPAKNTINTTNYPKEQKVGMEVVLSSVAACVATLVSKSPNLSEYSFVLP